MGAKIYKPNIFGKATTKINASEKSNTELKLIVIQAQQIHKRKF